MCCEKPITFANKKRHCFHDETKIFSKQVDTCHNFNMPLICHALF